MSAPEGGLSLLDKLRQSLKPLGGEMRIDRFIDLMARERARAAAEAQAARERAAAPPEPPQPPDSGAPAKGPAAPGGQGEVDLQDEVKAFLHRDEIQEARKDEVADFMDFMGNAAFDPDSLPE